MQTTPTTSPDNILPFPAAKRAPLFQIVRCVLINDKGRVLATGHMKIEDLHRRNDMLTDHGHPGRWRVLSADSVAA